MPHDEREDAVACPVRDDVSHDGARREPVLDEVEGGPEPEREPGREATEGDADVVVHVEARHERVAADAARVGEALAVGVRERTKLRLRDDANGEAGVVHRGQEPSEEGDEEEEERDEHRHTVPPHSARERLESDPERRASGAPRPSSLRLPAIEDGVRRCRQTLQIVDERGAVASSLRAREIRAGIAVEGRELGHLVGVEAAEAADLHPANDRIEPVPVELAPGAKGDFGQRRDQRHEPGVLEEGGASVRPALAAAS